MDITAERNLTSIIIIGIITAISLALAVISMTRSMKGKQNPNLLLDSILFLGLASFSFPMVTLLIGLYSIAKVVHEGAEISSSLSWMGIWNILPIVIAGFIALHVSFIAWFAARRIKV